MTVLAILAWLALLAWIWLALLRGMFWRTDVRLPRAPEPAEWPSVAVVVPARDEAAVLPGTLPALLGQRYPGRARVILVDDGSTDGTGALGRALAGEPASGAAPLPLEVIEPAPPPPGWTGKPWALRAGVAAAGEAEFLLLTDADIEHPPDSLATLVCVAVAGRLDLVSQMARLRAVTRWERLIVPAFVYFFALLYPFRWSNRPGARTAAAAGGCVLVRRAALERAGGIDAISSALIDDVALARAVKRSGGSTFLGLADGVASVRPYPTLGSLWQMVARSAYAQLRHSVPLLSGTVLGLLLVFATPPVATLSGLLAGDPAVLFPGLFGWLLMAGLYVPMLRYHRLPVVAALALPITAALYLGMTIDSARRHRRGGGGAWKGRTYPGQPVSRRPVPEPDPPPAGSPSPTRPSGRQDPPRRP